jgi:hypothetical protein
MIAAEMARRYAKGESLSTLAREYHLAKRTVARLVRTMGGEIRPSGFDNARRQAGLLASGRKSHEKRMHAHEHCKRCEILLRYDPGQDGLCGECWEETRNG